SGNQNLPGFITMCPGYPIQESQNWQSGFLPGVYQGTYIDTRKKTIDRLIEHIRNKKISLSEQRRQLNFIQRLNQKHLQDRQNDRMLESRIQSFELAYRMQLEATDAFDIEKEPPYIREMYGNGLQARQILMARRLVEVGVPFVEVNLGGWDNHQGIHDILQNQRLPTLDRAMSALSEDLEQRGMLENTAIIWMGEFGRTPTINGNAGRDHWARSWSVVVGGGGIKGGLAVGETDAEGRRVTSEPYSSEDLMATVCKGMGINMETTYQSKSGRPMKIANGGKIIKELIA
ncbi:MAG: DUF1501 domain-containing protein, partial [Planctomycetota bacterium]